MRQNKTRRSWLPANLHERQEETGCPRGCISRVAGGGGSSSDGGGEWSQDGRLGHDGGWKWRRIGGGRSTTRSGGAGAGVRGGGMTLGCGRWGRRGQGGGRGLGGGGQGRGDGRRAVVVASGFRAGRTRAKVVRCVAMVELGGWPCVSPCRSMPRVAIAHQALASTVRLDGLRVWVCMCVLAYTCASHGCGM